MDDYKVRIVAVERITEHPNADRLELAHYMGWQCVVQKGKMKTGDLAAYLPIDSVLPPELESILFPADSKIKLSKSRIKTLKLRGAISQGMMLSISDPVMDKYFRGVKHGDDVTDVLGITHYEPPAASPGMQGSPAAKKHINPNFPAYSKLSHFKNYPTLFTEGEEVVVTEKIHGTNFRAGWVPPVADTLWKKVQKFFGYLPEWEFVYGSHNVQLNGKRNWKGFYSQNVYREAVEKYQLETRIPMGYVVYGEIYGDGIQKGYHYGLTGERKLVIFDVLVTKIDNTQEYGSWYDVQAVSSAIQVPTAPILYIGPYAAEKMPLWETGPTLLQGQPHREGCVIKPRYEAQCWIGRKVLRSINAEYLLINETDFH